MTFKEQTGLQLLDQCCRNIIQFFVTFSLAMSYSCFRRSNGIARIMLETWYATVFWWFWGLETCKSRELGGDTMGRIMLSFISALYFPQNIPWQISKQYKFLIWLTVAVLFSQGIWVFYTTGRFSIHCPAGGYLGCYQIFLVKLVYWTKSMLCSLKTNNRKQKNPDCLQRSLIFQPVLSGTQLSLITLTTET